METLILEAISIDMYDRKVFRSCQHGFTKGKSCLTNLIAFYNERTAWMDEGRVVAFNIISHNIFIGKLKKCGLDEWIVRWTENRLNGRTQKVVISGTGSSWSPVV
ncbi:RNA-directed DNA polymerase from mobile element jockey-like protein [Willisornis vidua]|uniref:RNA-directed DNA polymerase from mobile element jockey-like protein n=1 Tax=Willisornis vidua TaxID=1566151 RepID=A0ABQ9DQH0_9PASS|nr:RNA-directed DNA polymerase from mobile element jockey-like protein [Willisornis vidua]